MVVNNRNAQNNGLASHCVERLAWPGILCEIKPAYSTARVISYWPNGERVLVEKAVRSGKYARCAGDRRD